MKPHNWTWGFSLISAVGLLGAAAAAKAPDSWDLKNHALSWHGTREGGKLGPSWIRDRINQQSLGLIGEPFQVVLEDGTVLKASDCTLEGEPSVESLKPEPASPTAARHEAGRQFIARFSAPARHLSAEWRVVLRDQSTYLREELVLRATGADVLVKEIVLFQQPLAGARTIGSVEGSPVVAGTWFVGYEHPMARNTVDTNQLVVCRFLRNAVLKDQESLTQSCVLGLVPEGQLRRGFLDYVERERAHPYRPFLHYNAWYDIAWDDRKFNEAESLDAISQFGTQLTRKRGVVLDSLLLDDGWDDNQTLWQFHTGFPRGFTPLKEAAAGLHTSIGVWLSPFGGYATARTQRLAYAAQFGFETNRSGFSLAGSKYYQRFHDICLEMVRKYGVNQFKFDGLAAGGKAAANGLTRDGDAMLRLIADLRAARPDLFINQTTGTWPSPFWLLYVDSTWRGGEDHDFSGKGPWRQKWITYRDTETYRSVVSRGPLYPLNSLMVHGLLFATNAVHLQTADDQEFADEIHDYFGSGTQLQELYLSPRLLNPRNWDDLAEAAKWSRANAQVLVDTHWVGGDPGKGEVYGWASWSPHKGILVLRNPDDQPATFSGDVKALFELPEGARGHFKMHSPWGRDRNHPSVALDAGLAHVFELKPFEVLVLESR